MRHPVDKLGDDRICPETGLKFVECWTNSKKEPWSFFNECDQCSKDNKSIAEMLHKLNQQRKIQKG